MSETNINSNDNINQHADLTDSMPDYLVPELVIRFLFGPWQISDQQVNDVNNNNVNLRTDALEQINEFIGRSEIQEFILALGPHSQKVVAEYIKREKTYIMQNNYFSLGDDNARPGPNGPPGQTASEFLDSLLEAIEDFLEKTEMNEIDEAAARKIVKKEMKKEMKNNKFNTRKLQKEIKEKIILVDDTYIQNVLTRKSDEESEIISDEKRDPDVENNLNITNNINNTNININRHITINNMDIYRPTTSSSSLTLNLNNVLKIDKYKKTCKYLRPAMFSSHGIVKLIRKLVGILGKNLCGFCSNNERCSSCCTRCFCCMAVCISWSIIPHPREQSPREMRRSCFRLIPFDFLIVLGVYFSVTFFTCGVVYPTWESSFSTPDENPKTTPDDMNQNVVSSGVEYLGSDPWLRWRYSSQALAEKQCGVVWEYWRDSVLQLYPDAPLNDKPTDTRRRLVTRRRLGREMCRMPLSAKVGKCCN